MSGSPVGVGPTADPAPLRPARREARLSLWMLAVFAGWTALFIGLSGPVAELLGAPTSGGEVVYLEAWGPWIAVTLVWLLPVLVGLGLALDARRRDVRETLATAAIVVHAVLLAVVAGPPLLDRLIHLG